jgi:hypothetical protein
MMVMVIMVLMISHLFDMKYIYTFGVNAFFTYDIEANSEKEARDILVEKGGYDINGELHIVKADLMKEAMVRSTDFKSAAAKNKFLAELIMEEEEANEIHKQS